MRTPIPPCRLRFLIPDALKLAVAPGRHHPCLHGCVLTILQHGERDLMLVIEGPSRDVVFEQCRRFFRVAAKNAPALSIAATVETAPERSRSGRGGSDSWTIALNAQVSFSPTGLGAEVFPEGDPAGAAPQTSQGEPA